MFLKCFDIIKHTLSWSYPGFSTLRATLSPLVESRGRVSLGVRRAQPQENMQFCDFNNFGLIFMHSGVSKNFMVKN